MIERTEQVKTKDGTMEVFTVRPDGPGPFPVVVQLMDALGMREELHDHARRAASWGYYVVQPDFLYRNGLKGPLDMSNPEMRSTVMAAVGNLTDDRARSDLQDALKIADGDKAARRGQIGLYGFCLGGRLAMVFAQALGDRAVAAASIHPGNLVEDGPGSTHRNLDRVKAECYFAIADQDFMATPEQMAEMEKALKANKVRYELEWYPARHGFMNPSRKDVHVPAAAEKAWGCIKALFDRTLK